MRKISLKKYQQGMKLARTIYSEVGQPLVTAGAELRPSYIFRLEQMSISEIYIEDDYSKGIVVSDVVDERTRIEARKLVKSVMNDYRVFSNIKTEKIKKMVDLILDELLYHRDIMVNLSDIKAVDEYTFSHSVNVCILSLITGIKMGLDQLKLRDLGIGALLHDIGKAAVPEEILKKPAELTDKEFDIMKQHTVLGFEMLRQNLEISTTSAFVAIGHHERYNGSGYPRGIKGEEIHLFARIVATADIFDALTSDRIYKRKMPTHEAVDYMNTIGKDYFDTEILRCFLKNIALYAIGTSVLLDSGEKGIIVDVNRNFPTRPIVRIIYNADGKKLNDFEEMDLTRKLNRFIVDVCEL